MGLLRRGDRRGWEDAFVAYYAARGHSLRRTAYLLCGDWHLAEDLTQATFAKLYRNWERIERHDVLDQYARRVLLRTYLDQRRRPWRREVPTPPDSEAMRDGTVGGTTRGTVDGAVDDSGAQERALLRDALMGLPVRHRAVLVLRFWADLPVEQVAAILECPVGTVKSQTARALNQLRTALGDRANLVPSEEGT